MQVADLGDVRLHYKVEGEGPVLVFANSLGTDMRLWDKVVARLPGYRIVRYDMRGHGLSTCPTGKYTMDQLISDAERLMEHLELGPSSFIGLSIGGLVGQGLAARRPDLVRALVLACTASRMGTQEMWEARIAAAEAGGIGALADAIMERWFSDSFRSGVETELWRNMVTRTPLAGYNGCGWALSVTDLSDETRQIRVPTLGIAGTEDGAATPDQVQATTDLIPGAVCKVIEGVGHLPPVEAPDTFTGLLTDFLRERADG